MGFTTYATNRLVKGEDLNHHGTLYAGRSSEWFVESGFIAAAHLVPPEHVVCLQIHNMLFTKPVRKGEVVCFESRIVYTGNTSMIAYIHMIAHGEVVLEGFITFVHVDSSGRPLKHGVQVTPTTPEEIELHKKAMKLRQS
jgi:acyl-CoA hydrolase